MNAISGEREKMFLENKIFETILVIIFRSIHGLID